VKTLLNVPTLRIDLLDDRVHLVQILLAHALEALTAAGCADMIAGFAALAIIELTLDGVVN